MAPTPPPTPPEDPSAGPTEGPSAANPSPSVEWRLASPDGTQQFGPTVPAVFAQWITEGRVQPDWLVWRSDWSEWKTAAEAAADLPVPLLPAASPQAAPPQAHIEPSSSPLPTGASYTARRRRSKRQQRTLALVLGVVTLGLLGVLVWLVLG